MTYRKTEREVAASFEIGCFHALLDFYSGTCRLAPQNLSKTGDYRYLTTPNGNPANFSFIHGVHGQEEFDIRQQVRIRSHLHPDIAFAPDLTVLRAGTRIEDSKDDDDAGGSRRLFRVSSHDVIAAHECKSMNPFPELLVSFLGALVAAHAWLDGPSDKVLKPTPNGLHLAPTLFVGGTPRALHLRMITALESCYPINIVAGLHSGTWNLRSRYRTKQKLRRLTLLSHRPAPSSSRPAHSAV